MGKFLMDLSHVLFDSDVGEVEEVISNQANTNTTSLSHSPGLSVPKSATGQSGENSFRVASGSDYNQGSSQAVVDAVNPFYAAFPVFNGSDAVYLTSVDKSPFIKASGNFPLFVFRVDKGADSFYIRSPVLARYGYHFELVDHCLVRVESESGSRFLTCPPISNPVSQSDDNELIAGRGDDVIKKVDIFSM
ncbi:hypothetical protein VCRA2116O29_1120001 [Vibrio crassostreae]|nr:hypothetical protein VCRA2116O29_1120001 [Vibrio crassostreae]